MDVKMEEKFKPEKVEDENKPAPEITAREMVWAAFQRVTQDENLGEWLNRRSGLQKTLTQRTYVPFCYLFVFSRDSIGQETAEKQTPSALEFLGQFGKAIENLKRSSGKPLPLSQSLSACIADYNRLTVQRKYKARLGGVSVHCMSANVEVYWEARQQSRNGDELWLQSDNTIKEVKNGLSGVVMAALVNCRYFDECGLPAAIPRSERLPRRYEHNASDVFCLLKQDLCDAELSQPALLVWPGDELARSRAFWQAATSHRGKHFDLDPDRARDLLELADVLDSYPQYARATAYMRGLTGLSYEILAIGHFVPGSERWELGRYKGKELWREIMEVTDYASVVYVQRAIEMFESRKQAQLTPDEHQNLMDIVLVWLWLRPKVATAVDGDMMTKLDDMFRSG
ncbi:Uncharacterized protein SCF082_LOCUS11081 [Durusdinium trenchii]|uniref:Uncharacterized protein n=1 Tax=Durusdinium trenchii TaxID=1381693 RepID=A0ABP0JAN1_9DINO